MDHINIAKRGVVIDTLKPILLPRSVWGCMLMMIAAAVVGLSLLQTSRWLSPNANEWLAMGIVLGGSFALLFYLYRIVFYLD